MPSNPTDQQLQLSPRILRDNNNSNNNNDRRLPLCAACLCVAFNAWETPHGCRLCGHCHGKMLQLELGQPCPSDSHLGLLMPPNFRRQDCREDVAVRSELASVVVRCPNQLLGCQFADQFKKLPDHSHRECRYRNVRCPLCPRIVLIANLERHQCSDECRQFILDNFGNFDRSHDVSLRGGRASVVGAN